MTALVRIEKADATDFILSVYEETRQPDGSWVRAEVYTDLDWPANATEKTLWDGKRLVIEETGTNNMIYTNRNDFYKWMERATTAERQLKELRDLVNAENQGEEPK